ncbi:MAG: tRNA lysidine(34) synthetase TilS [bacterium]|nr:tRNA lysidine(34) synthetase TilS [bacterium]
MFSEFIKTIKKYSLLSGGEKVLVGVSGGIDSMVLLALLQRFVDKFKGGLVVAHLNHGLRGDESDRDEEFVKSAAKKMDLVCITKKIDIGHIALKEGLNLQDAARRERYAFFGEVFKDQDCDRIALGHNSDDQAETVLMRIIRGSGIKGLGGIPPERGVIIRPIIELSRENIADYASVKGIDFREDSSNLKDSYLRNKLRRQLIPTLKEYNPRICNELNMLSSINRDVESYLQDEAEKAFKKAVCHEGEDAGAIFLDVSTFNEIPVALRAKVVMKAVAQLAGNASGLFSAHILDVENLALNAASGRSINLPKGIIVSLEYGRLIFSCDARTKGDIPFKHSLNIPGDTIIKEAGMVLRTSKAIPDDSILQGDKKTIYLDMKRFSEPLEVRNFIAGDRIRIKGMRGRKKLKDLFIDEKIPPRLRRKIPILVSGDEILWVIGLRQSKYLNTEPLKGELIKVQSLDLSC